MTLLLGIPLFLFPYVLHQVIEPYVKTHQLNINLNTYNIAGLLFIPVVIFHVAMAYLKPAQSKAHIEQYTWNAKMLRLPKAETEGIDRPWYQSLILWWAVVTAMFVIIYIVFW